MIIAWAYAVRRVTVTALVVALAANLAAVFNIGPAAAQSSPASLTPGATGTKRKTVVPTVPPAAEKPKPAAVEPAMQVHLVRSAAPGCEPDCPEWIAAQGRIDAASPSQFNRVLSKLGNRRLPVFIDSGGGAVDASLAIGRQLRAKKLDIFVTKTSFSPCAPADTACRKKQPTADLRGLPSGVATKCASACAFILAGGNRRFVGPRGLVGVHQIVTFQSNYRVQRTYEVTTHRVWGVPVETQKRLVAEKRTPQGTVKIATTAETYDKVRRYFAEMGVKDAIMPLLLSAQNSSMRWLNPGELRSTGLATDGFDGEQLILGATAARSGPPPIMSPGPAHPTASDRAILPCRLVAGLPVDCGDGASRPGPTSGANPVAPPATAITGGVTGNNGVTDANVPAR